MATYSEKKEAMRKSCGVIVRDPTLYGRGHNSGVTVSTPDGTMSFYMTWLNHSPGNAGLSQDDWRRLVNYVRDGLGYGAIDSVIDAPIEPATLSALGPRYARVYQRVRCLLANWSWNHLKSPGERIISMILRDIHKNSPLIFDSLVKASKNYEVEAAEGAAAGLPLGGIASLMRQRGAAALAAQGAAIEAAARAAAQRQSDTLTQGGGGGGATEEGSNAPLIAVAVLLIILAALAARRRGLI